MSLLRLKLLVLACTVVVLTLNSAQAAIVYGTTLNPQELVRIDTTAGTFTNIHATAGSPDSLILRGNTLIFDENNLNTVKIFDLTAMTETLIANNTNGILGPQDLVLEPGGGSILVSNFSGNTITRVLLNGTQNGTQLGGTIVAPQGITYDSTGRLFVITGGSGTCPATGTAVIEQLSPTTGAVIMTSAGFDASNSLDGMLFDPFSGHLWVTSKCSGNLYEVDPATLALLSTFCTNTGVTGACAAGATSAPDGLATDGHGTLFLVLRFSQTSGAPNAEVAAFSITPRTQAVTNNPVPGLDDLSQVIAVAQTVAKSFSAPTCPPILNSCITLNGTTTLTITVTNSNLVPLTGVTFTDTFPTLPGVIQVAATPNATNTCGGTFTALPGATSVMLTAGNVAAQVGITPGTCTVTVDVTGVVAGTNTNSVTVTSNEGGPSPPATATITVNPPAIAAALLAKAFNPTTIGVGGTTTLTFNVTNPNALAALSAIAFSDTLPAGLVFVGGVTGTCNGTAPVITLPNIIALAGATLAGGGTCTFSATVMSTAAGSYSNVTTTVTALGPNGGPVTGGPATAPLIVALPATDFFQIRYASNLNIGDSFVNITNTGSSTTATSAGNLCVNVYTFDQSEELLSCCTCFVTPNGLSSLSVKNSLISNNLTPEIPNSVVIKLLATAAGASSSSCNAALPPPSAFAGGLRAWGTTLHAKPTTPVTYGVTETPFTVAALSAGELAHVTTFCAFIQANASGFGICKGCSPGGLGAVTTQ